MRASLLSLDGDCARILPRELNLVDFMLEKRIKRVSSHNTHS